MKRPILLILGLALCAPAFAGETQLQKATNVVNEIMGSPGNGIPHDLLDRAVCVGIVPSQVKFAWVFGATYGRGMLVCRKGGNGEWDAPSMFTMGGVSVGWQAGGKATDVVFLVMNPDGMKTLVQDSIKLGTELSLAAGPVGRTAEGATDVQLRAQILSYSRSRGLFGGASLDGAVYKQDECNNQIVYGRKVTAKEILIDGAVPTPDTAQDLDGALTRYSPVGGQTFGRP
jgi:lipid-binding SYLF domain-containing protein